MILPGGGFFTLAGWLLLINYRHQRREALDEGDATPQEAGR